MHKKNPPIKSSGTFDMLSETEIKELEVWAETAQISENALISKSEAAGAGMDLLATALGSKIAVHRAVGKPSLSGRGISPARSVRLPADMDEKLIERAEHDQIKPSEVIRRALDEYLSRAS
ncbi:MULTISPECIES: hypothetical protein [Micrococcaceae]|uniref:hypothetical protein n=1 Tax=Micrococcaceae TaxID=1268 RepID=UPI0010363F78|nr:MULTISPECIES: hypothetical protein [Micrococcaceae]TAP28512.1 hypothetical protein EYR88_09520 [Arthrobacter sp. S41]UXN32659.1 hypothetical protein N6V40_04145 [Glutamicibacter sp. M10]